jgi:hypothetical protein
MNMPDDLDLPELELALQARYPELNIERASLIGPYPPNGRVRSQCIRFSGRLAALKGNGLLTDAMVAWYCPVSGRSDYRRKKPRPPVGDDFFLVRAVMANGELAADLWQLYIYTEVEADPRERADSRELRRAAKRALAAFTIRHGG